MAGSDGKGPRLWKAVFLVIGVGIAFVVGRNWEWIQVRGANLFGPTAPAFDPAWIDPTRAYQHARVEEKVEKAVRRSEGGRISLTDGFELFLPPNTLGADDTVTIERIYAPAAANHLLSDHVLYRLKTLGAGGALTGQARLSFPLRGAKLPAQPPVEEAALYHLKDDGTCLRLPVRVRGGRAIGEIESFSVVWLGVAALVAFTEASSVAAKATLPEGSVRLTVPYYSQGDHEWCWAASGAMVIGAHGGHAQPQDIAAVFRAHPQQGGSMFPELVGGTPLDTAIQRLGTGLPEGAVFEVYGRGGLSEGSLRRWIMLQLRGNRPVWFGLKHFRGWGTSDHAIVVVGYNDYGFLVHDPSGVMVEHILDYRHERGVAMDVEVDDHALAYVGVSWDDWERMGSYVSWFNHVAVMNYGVSRPRARDASLQVASGTGWQFHREGVAAKAPDTVSLYWNGKAKKGCGFSLAGDADTWGLEGLSNSDCVSTLSALVHNVGAAFQATLLVHLVSPSRLDQLVSLPVAVPRQRTNVEIPIPVVAGVSRQRPSLPTLYTPGHVRKALPLGEALDFPRHPLPPGDYRFLVELKGPAGSVLDRVDVPFRMSPAVVPKVNAVKFVHHGSEVIAHHIEWLPSPEATRSPAPHTYRIYRRYRRKGRPSRGDELVATISNASLEPASMAVSLPEPDDAHAGDQTRYRVTYVDARTGYESPLGPFSSVVDWRFPPAPTKKSTTPSNRSCVVKEYPLAGSRPPFNQWSVIAETQGNTMIIHLVQHVANNPFKDAWLKAGKRPDVIRFEILHEPPKTLKTARREAETRGKKWVAGN